MGLTLSIVGIVMIIVGIYKAKKQLELL